MPLATWQNAYAHCQTEVVNIVVLGDSRSIVDSTITPTSAGQIADTFGQKWADRLRTLLEARCGSHGSGLVPFLPLAGLNALNSDYYQATGSWEGNDALGPYQFGSVPASLTLQATSPLTLQFTNGALSII